MSLDDIYKLLTKSVEDLNYEQPGINLNIQQRLAYAHQYWSDLRKDYYRELSGEIDDLFSEEIVSLFLDINSSLESIEISHDTSMIPSMIIDDNKAQQLKNKIIKLYDLIKNKIKTLDGLEDVYRQ